MTHLRDSKFIISCAARTGSTMLVHMLRSHPDVLCHGELFEPTRIGQLDGAYAPRRRADPALDQRLMDYRTQRPEAFFYDVVYDTQGRRAVGFKFKTDEAFDPAYADISDLIARDPDIKVLHLRRMNLLDQFVSHQVVLRQAGVTLLAHDAPPPEPTAFTVDPKELVEYAQDIVQRERRAGATYGAHRQGVVSYEGLLERDPTTRNRMQAFLGVKPMPLSTPTRKIIRRNVDLVENLDEAVAAMTAAGMARRCVIAPPEAELGEEAAGSWPARLWRRTLRLAGRDAA